MSKIFVITRSSPFPQVSPLGSLHDPTGTRHDHCSTALKLSLRVRVVTAWLPHRREQNLQYPQTEFLHCRTEGFCLPQRSRRCFDRTTEVPFHGTSVYGYHARTFVWIHKDAGDSTGGEDMSGFDPEERPMISEIPIGEKYVLTGTVTHGPARAGAGQSLRTVFRLADDTGTSLWVSAYDHDFPHCHHVGISQGDRVGVVGHVFRCAGVLDEFHASSIDPDPG